jgi:hypothetical protein
MPACLLGLSAQSSPQSALGYPGGGVEGEAHVDSEAGGAHAWLAEWPGCAGVEGPWEWPALRASPVQWVEKASSLGSHETQLEFFCDHR